MQTSQFTVCIINVISSKQDYIMYSCSRGCMFFIKRTATEYLTLIIYYSYYYY